MDDGIVAQIEFCAEHCKQIISDITAKRDDAQALSLLRVYAFAFEREVATLELRDRMRQVFGQSVAADSVPGSEKKSGAQIIPFRRVQA